jgi:SpoVK/Ycf46/Vps4 family AAA+-type ATPase
LTKRVSDLLGAYVGTTEKLIARAFEEASDTESILVLDEADCLLSSRTEATQRWETTQVAEFLTQLETYDGIFFASTNLWERVDEAAYRRFDFKIRFGHLTLSQRRQLLGKVLGVDSVDGCGLERLDGITPGDFTVVVRQFHVLGVKPTAADFIRRLEREMSFKAPARSIGFR